MKSKHRFINAPLEISSEQVNHPWTMPEAHSHGDYEIYILLSGSRTIWNGDTVCEVTAGDAMFFCPEIPHKSSGKDAFSGICIHFSEKLLREYFSKKAISELLECFQAPVVSLSKQTVQFIERHASSFQINQPGNYLLLANILFLCCTDAQKEMGEDTFNTPSFKSLPEKILDYVQHNYSEIQDIPDISEYFQISEGYVYKVIKSKTGLTPKSYINDLRMQNVLRELRNCSQNTLKKIAANSGYSSYEYFCRLFKSKYGVNPSEYRKRFL